MELCIENLETKLSIKKHQEGIKKTFPRSSHDAFPTLLDVWNWVMFGKITDIPRRILYCVQYSRIMFGRRNGQGKPVFSIYYLDLNRQTN